MMHAYLCIKTCRHVSLLTQSNESHLNSQCEVGLWAITWANYWHMMISRWDTDTCVFDSHWIWNMRHRKMWHKILVSIQLTVFFIVMLPSLVDKHCTCHTGSQMKDKDDRAWKRIKWYCENGRTHDTLLCAEHKIWLLILTVLHTVILASNG